MGWPVHIPFVKARLRGPAVRTRHSPRPPAPGPRPCRVPTFSCSRSRKLSTLACPAQRRPSTATSRWSRLPERRPSSHSFSSRWPRSPVTDHLILSSTHARSLPPHPFNASMTLRRPLNTTSGSHRTRPKPIHLSRSPGIPISSEPSRHPDLARSTRQTRNLSAPSVKSQSCCKRSGLVQAAGFRRRT